MLNRITGWTLITQVSYLAAFILLTAFNQLTANSIFKALSSLRSATGLEHRLTRVSDYLYYPFVLSAPLNVILLLLFLRRCQRQGSTLSLPLDVFNLLNAVYILASGWIIFASYAGMLRR